MVAAMSAIGFSSFVSCLELRWVMSLFADHGIETYVNVIFIADTVEIGF
jgi:hypothetical protein